MEGHIHIYSYSYDIHVQCIGIEVWGNAHDRWQTVFGFNAWDRMNHTVKRPAWHLVYMLESSVTCVHRLFFVHNGNG